MFTRSYNNITKTNEVLKKDFRSESLDAMVLLEYLIRTNFQIMGPLCIDRPSAIKDQGNQNLYIF